MRVCDAIDGYAIFFRQSGDGAQPPPTLVGRFPSVSKLNPYIDGWVGKVLLGGAKLVKKRRGHHAAFLPELCVELEFFRDGSAYKSESGDSRNSDNRNSKNQRPFADDDPQAQRVETAEPTHCPAAVTRRPPVTTPITTSFNSTSPFRSNVMVPVTPSNGTMSRPTRDR